MLGMGWPEMALIAVLAMLLFGPDRLPGLAKQAATFVRAARQMLDQAKEQVGKELGHDLTDYGLSDLDPRAVIRRAIQDDDAPSTGLTASVSVTDVGELMDQGRTA